jgi:hypothetical protein
MVLARMELVKDLVQETVDRGVSAAEQIHAVIVGLPFEVLDALGVPDALRLRNRLRRAIGVTYGAVRDANRYVGELLSDAFEAIEDGRHATEVLGDAESAAARGRPSRPS